jgi:ferrous iron transport protein A
MIIIYREGKSVTLADVKKGQKFKIDSIVDPNVRAQAIRFGIAEGAEVVCFEKIPLGPVIIGRGLQEVAVGRKLAEKIYIQMK